MPYKSLQTKLVKGCQEPTITAAQAEHALDFALNSSRDKGRVLEELRKLGTEPESSRHIQEIDNNLTQRIFNKALSYLKLSYQSPSGWNSAPCTQAGQSWMYATQCTQGKELDPKALETVSNKCGGEPRMLPRAVDSAIATRTITQALLKKAFPSGKVKVYRGSGVESGGAHEQSGDVFFDGRRWLLPVRTLSSWSTSEKIARSFGRCVVSKEVSINRVAAFSPFVPGMTPAEREIVLEADGPYEEIPPEGVICKVDGSEAEAPKRPHGN